MTNTSLMAIKTETIDIIANKVKDLQSKGDIQFPADYSPENAMRAAWLVIQDCKDRSQNAALDVCDKNSVQNSLFRMVIQGLNPVKGQCYFIVYGKTLTLSVSPYGDMHIAKTMDPSIKDIFADVVYKGDTFKYVKKNGKNIITEHCQELGNIDKAQIIAAYATVLFQDGSEYSVIKTFDEIKQSWKQSPLNPVGANGEVSATSTHGKFTAEMCKKTLIHAICKPIIRSSSDRSILGEIYAETEQASHEASIEAEIEEKANALEIDFDVETGEVMPEALAEIPVIEDEDGLPN